MRKTLSFLALSLIAIGGKAQTADVEKSISGVQVGLFGLELYNETKIANKTTLKAELGLLAGVWGGDMYAKTGFAFYPSLVVMPKYYYNIDKRAEKGKNTKNNAGNYFGLQVNYIPNWFVISNEKNLNLNNQMHFIPTYGIRRNFGGNFNYEFRAGIGYSFTFGSPNNTSGTSMDLSFKVGYDF